MAGAYYPILRPRRGELAALHHLDPAAAEQVVPIVELRGERLTPLLKALPPRTPALAVDLGDQDIPLLLARDLADLDVAMIPVLRADDSDHRLLESGLIARL